MLESRNAIPEGGKVAQSQLLITISFDGKKIHGTDIMTMCLGKVNKEMIDLKNRKYPDN